MTGIISVFLLLSYVLARLAMWHNFEQTHKSVGFLESYHFLTRALTLPFIFFFFPFGMQMWWLEQQRFCYLEEASKRIIDIIASIALNHWCSISNYLPQDFLLHEKNLCVIIWFSACCSSVAQSCLQPHGLQHTAGQRIGASASASVLSMSI